MLKFDASIFGGELPIGLGVVGIAVVLQAAISAMRVCLSGMRRSRHWDVRTPSSDSARSSQLPCFGPDRAVAGTIDNAEFYDLVLQQPQGPACASLGRLGTGQGNQLGLLLAVKNPSNGRHRARLAAQHRLEALFH